VVEVWKWNILDQRETSSRQIYMMKIIENDYRLDNLLNVWTGKIPLSSGSYYFWAAGSRHQRSLVGLYRTLLFRILKAQNFPCRIAFPEWQLRFAKIKPSLEMFVAAMRNLLGSQALTTNFFFIIDGPDEFERDSIGKAELAELMLEMTKTRRVKILLSSRPETPFENAFGSCPRLRLETLTRPDILAYISAKLWANPLLRKMPPHEESQVRQITNALSDSAEGVFLWVVLVSESS
jgi:hypothetical protein